MGAKAFPAESSTSREELENASLGSGPMLASFRCPRACGGDVKIARTMLQVMTIQRIRCVPEKPARRVLQEPSQLGTQRSRTSNLAVPIARQIYVQEVLPATDKSDSAALSGQTLQVP